MLEEVIDGGEVKVHLAEMFRCETARLELDDDMAAETGVVEEQIEEEVLVADLEVDLASDEGEAGAEFKEEVLDMGDQASFQFFFATATIGADEVEEVGIFEDLGGKVRVCRRQSGGEIVLGFALAEVLACLDLVDEDGLGPAVAGGGFGIPEAGGGIGELVEQGDIVTPRQLCNGALHNCLIRPSDGEGPHVFEIAWREAGHVGESFAEVSGEAVDNFGAPAFVFLTGQDDGADLPVAGYEGNIGGDKGTQTGLRERVLDLFQGSGVVAGHFRFGGGGSEAGFFAAGTATGEASFVRKLVGAGGDFARHGDHTGQR